MENVSEAIGQFKNKRVLVIGDIMLDQYTEGSVAHISPEAPVPVLRKHNERFVPGGAGNVANNVAALGGQTVLLGVIGKDSKGILLLRLLKEKKIDTKNILVLDRKPTTVKERVVAGNNQLVRVDHEDTSNLTAAEEKKFLHSVQREIKKTDVIILSDYAKGLFSHSLSQKIISLAKKNKKIIVADFKPKNKAYFIGTNIITPNLKEAEEMTGLKDIEKIGNKLVKDFASYVIVTLGENGITIFSKNIKSHHLPAKKIKVFDVSGAGDTICAVLALSIASGLSIADAAVLANNAGGIVVQKPGTATLSNTELIQSLGTQNHTDNIETIEKLWGNEKWLENNEKYCCKLLSLKKDFQSSLHYHKKKDEMFLVTNGHVKMELGKEVLHLHEGNFARILPGIKHRFTGIEDSTIIESSTFHDEKDVFRIEKSKKIK